MAEENKLGRTICRRMKAEDKVKILREVLLNGMGQGQVRQKLL